MNLAHYTREPMAFDPHREYEQLEPHSEFGKPEGFWVSIKGEDDWHSWVSENMDAERLNFEHRVTLAESARVHVIDSESALAAFTGTYAVQTEWTRRWYWREGDKRKWPIDWREVAKDADGVIVTPYQWPCRNAFDWYYTWDCASGCIWNLSAIASVRQVVAA